MKRITDNGSKSGLDTFVAMAKTYRQLMLYPIDEVWRRLPDAVMLLANSDMGQSSDRYHLHFSTGASLRSWGQHVDVDLRPQGPGTQVVVTTRLKLGLIDWGEGGDLADQLFATVERMF